MRLLLLIAALMFAASVAAILARPSTKASELEATFSLEAAIPRSFGEWREEPQRYVQVVNPQTKELLDKLYSQVLSRIYVNASGNHMMLSLAYGSDQRRSLQAHKPEVCYPAQGFAILKNEAALLGTAFGDIPIRRVVATAGARHEPLTYWFTVGDRAVEGKMQKRLVDLRYGLTGRIPDGMIFRVSSIDSDYPHAFALQGQFIDQLLQALPPPERKRLSGLGNS
jgi:EpsI family protein